MIDLNNTDELKKLDPKNTLGSTQMLPDQVDQIWNDGKDYNPPQDFANAKNIIICGMGGSSYGGHIIKSLFADKIKVPLDVINDYHLPAYASKDSLVILTSYSGTTEETLSCLEGAKNVDAKIVALTSGGDLAKAPNSFVFSAKFNPSGQPRLAPGYIVFGTCMILSKLGFVQISDDDIKKAISEVRANQSLIIESAKELAKEIKGSIPAIFASSFLVGNAHIIRNQFNETSKSFSAFEDIPELNHHLMEGLKNPEDKKIIALFITSSFYSDKHTKRIEVTKDVINQNNVKWAEYQAKGNSPLSQALNVLSFGGYITLFLAFLYELDPSLIPWVNYFKEQLKK